MNWIFIAIFLAVLIVIANVAATYYIKSAPAYEPSQKKIQLIIVWLVPILGAAFFSYFLWQDRKKYRYQKQVGNNTSITNQDAVSYYFGANHRGGR